MERDRRTSGGVERHLVGSVAVNTLNNVDLACEEKHDSVSTAMIRRRRQKKER